MKLLVVQCASLLMLVAGITAQAEILAGPIHNPVNGHDYYLLTPNNWPGAEAEAENLGGTLAIIRNAAEQKWIFGQFGHDGEKERNLWIGLRRQWPGGPFVWPDGSPLDYANWCNGQPDNGDGKENSVHLWADVHQNGGWNDSVEGASFNAVVEVPGRAEEPALTAREKALIGNWYENGRPDRLAWIAGTDNKLFLITHDRHAARLVLTSQDVIYDADRQYGEIVKNHIVWSNGTWWSRQPAKYVAVPKDENRARQGLHPDN